MRRYDLTDAADFLVEADVNPEDLYIEILQAMEDVDILRNKRNSEKVSAIWHTLLTCADFFETISVKK